MGVWGLGEVDLDRDEGIWKEGIGTWIRIYGKKEVEKKKKRMGYIYIYILELLSNLMDEETARHFQRNNN